MRLRPFARALTAAASLGGLAFACQLVDPLANLQSGGPPFDAGVEGGDGGAFEGGRDAATCDAEVSTDSKNCGFCGHDCRGSGCTDGVCAHQTVTSASVASMVLEQGTLYYTTPTGGGSGGVFAFDLATSTTKALATNQSSPDRIAARAPWVFWITGDDAIHRVTLDGGGPAIVGATNGSQGCLTVNGVHAYWSESTGDRIFRLPVTTDGGTKEPFLSPNGLACVSANDGVVVYGTTAGMGQFDLTANGPAPTALNGLTIDEVVLGSKYAYGIPRIDSPDGSTTATVHVVEVKTQTSAAIAKFTYSSNVSAVAGDDRGIYWGINGDAVYGCSDHLCTTGVHKYDDSSFPLALAVDDTWLYVYASGEGKIWRVAR